MQRIAAILSIFILLMSMAPCADAWEDSSCESEELCESSNDHEESDECLPFCSCMCCTAITTIALQSFEFQKVFTTTDDLKLEEIAYSSPAFDIWQPPKI